MTSFLANADGTRQHNHRLILDHIRQRADLSRSDLVRLTGLSKATVSAIVAELIEMGLVQETGNQNPTASNNWVGRPRISLSLVPDAHFALGAEVTTEECRVVLTNLKAEPIQRTARAVGSTDLSVPSLLQILEECVAAVSDGIDPSRILAFGVCVPGIVDSAAGVVTLSVILAWKNVPFAQELRQRFPFPVAVFSRGNAATWGERWYGAGRDVDNLLYLRVGTAVVGGLVMGGQPYLGRNYGAGELGHMTVQPDGALCRCGNRGCLATVATTDALLNRVRQLLRNDLNNPLWTAMQHNFDHLTLADVVEAAYAQNGVAQQALAEMGRWLGVALASTINLLNLEMVIIGGPLALAGHHLLTPLQNELTQRALPTHLANLPVVLSALKDDAPAVGAASLVLHDLFSPIPRALLPVLSMEKSNLLV
ncbi:MAG: ROK family transcriptional regulator [Caldilineaceae bacterium]|nr:ROK family transcriptional regulator [Caldilineaceae bacterium]